MKVIESIGYNDEQTITLMDSICTLDRKGNFKNSFSKVIQAKSDGNSLAQQLEISSHSRVIESVNKLMRTHTYDNTEN